MGDRGRTIYAMEFCHVLEGRDIGFKTITSSEAKGLSRYSVNGQRLSAPTKYREV